MRFLTATILAFLLAAQVGHAAELIMLEQAGCPWCARFNAEIAPAYAKTSEGKRAPLRRVDIHGPWPADLTGIAPERFTPTFILLDDGKEYGRIRGYPGDEFFWFRLDELLAGLPEDDRAAYRSSTTPLKPARADSEETRLPR